MGTSEVVRLGASAVPDIVDVYCDAFRDYPVMRFVLSDDGSYAERLPVLIHLFVAARAIREEPLLGIVRNDRLVAAATVSFPTDQAGPTELEAVREATWRELGAEARARYEACGEVWKTFAMPERHTHLNMIGVRRSAQGQGHARRLLDHVHGMSERSPGSEGVTLTTEARENVAFYQRAGYEIIGHARVSTDLETWGFFRRTTGGQ